MLSYEVPRSLTTARARIASGGVAFAGGTVLTPKLVPGTTLVALSALRELQGITQTSDAVISGAMVSLAELAASTRGGESCACVFPSFPATCPASRS